MARNQVQATEFLFKLENYIYGFYLVVHLTKRCEHEEKVPTRFFSLLVYINSILKQQYESQTK